MIDLSPPFPVSLSNSAGFSDNQLRLQEDLALSQILTFDDLYGHSHG
jgi:hypothetical protein